MQTSFILLRVCCEWFDGKSREITFIFVLQSELKTLRQGNKIARSSRRRTFILRN
jgi:hypothetical protein